MNFQFAYPGAQVADSKLVDDVAQVAAGGFSFAGGLYMFRWVVLWLTGRADRMSQAVDAERSELDQGWKAYRLTLEKRLAQQDERMERQDGKIADLMREVEDCHASKRALAADLEKLRGYTDGEGQARQLGATIAAADRLLDRGLKG